MTLWLTEWLTINFSSPLSCHDLCVTKSRLARGFGSFTETKQTLTHTRDRSTETHRKKRKPSGPSLTVRNAHMNVLKTVDT